MPFSPFPRLSPNMRQRVLSSLLLAPLVLAAVWLGGAVYDALVAAMAALGLREWLRLVGSRTGWVLLGFIYMTASAVALALLRQRAADGMMLVYFLLVCVWATDIGAFAAGRAFGGPKLAPAISPNKTWAGLFGGMASALILGYFMARAFGAMPAGVALWLAPVLALVAQAGDLFESFVKRRFGAKDSGDLIPGHGGVLDRVDGLVFAAMFLALAAQGGLFGR